MKGLKTDHKIDRARRLALQRLDRVSERARERGGMESPIPDALSALDRAMFNDLFNGVNRWRNLIDLYLQRFINRRFHKLPPSLLNILRLGAYQIRFQDRVPAYAAIDQSVRLARESGYKRQAPFVNGVLRNLDRHSDSLPEPESKGSDVHEIATYYSHPEWLVRRWVARFGIGNVRKLCAFNNLTPPLTLRTPPAERTEIIKSLAAMEVAVEEDAVIDGAIHCGDGAASVFVSDPFRSGRCHVQDGSSQLIAPLFQTIPIERALDACCGPGGKTLHLLDLYPLLPFTVALDPDERALRRLRDNAQRGKQWPRIQAIRADLLESNPLRSRRFQAVLLDTPCSGLGMIHRHPESRWNRDQSIITSMQRRQLSLLSVAFSLLTAGGRLIYSACTFETEETVDVISRFLSLHPECRRIPFTDAAPGQWSPFAQGEDMLLLPHLHRRSGYYAAVLERTR